MKKRAPYRMLNDSFWTSAEWRSLPPGRPSARALLMWLAVGPAQRRSVMGVPVPGVLILGDGEISEHLGWKPREVSRVMRELAAAGAVEQDRAANLIWLPWKFHHEPPTNTSVIIGWRTMFEQWPKGELAERVRQRLRLYLEQIESGADGDGRTFLGEYDKLPGNAAAAASETILPPHGGGPPSQLTVPDAVTQHGEGTHQGAVSSEQRSANSKSEIVVERRSPEEGTSQPVKSVDNSREDVTRFLPSSLRTKLTEVRQEALHGVGLQPTEGCGASKREEKSA